MALFLLPLALRQERIILILVVLIFLWKWSTAAQFKPKKKPVK